MSDNIEGGTTRPNTQIDANALYGAIPYHDGYRPVSAIFNAEILSLAQDMQVMKATGFEWKTLESAELPTDEKGFVIAESDLLKGLAEYYFERFHQVSKLPGGVYYDEDLARDASTRRAAEALVAIQDYVEGLSKGASAGRGEGRGSRG